ncbi:MAG: PQQ-dependent sugar dehydrogenase [Solirubrobacteraceae bacterium]|nr:PQQ-dependent sugar dehydrogenase [Solirubrobacteraceae bacterium]
MPALRPAQLICGLLLAGAAVGAAGCGDENGGSSGATPTAEPAPTATADSTADDATSSPASAPAPPARGMVRQIATGLEVPWDIDFLPGGDALVTERDSAKIVRITPGRSTPDEGITVPGVAPGGEGGLLGIAVSPRYERDGNVYVYFTAATDNRIVRMNLRTAKVTPILTGLRKGQIHNGGALSFGPDGRLYAGVGETGDTGLSQDPQSRNGKILRITTSGDAPDDNPTPGSPVWSLGHRNVQGLAWDSSDHLWASEFGQNTTDEVNLIEPGKNYGWPNVEGEGDTDGGRYTNPKVTLSPTSESSPSGAAVSGRELYVSGLGGRKLWRIPISGTDLGKPKALFTEQYGRIRAVAAAPDGSIWFSTSNRDGRGDPQDGDDRILQLGT